MDLRTEDMTVNRQGRQEIRNTGAGHGSPDRGHEGNQTGGDRDEESIGRDGRGGHGGGR